MSAGVYRRPVSSVNGFPTEYEGDYFFADYFSGVFRRIGFDGATWSIEPAPGQATAQDWATGALERRRAGITKSKRSPAPVVSPTG